jgi:hypothetical protein
MADSAKTDLEAKVRGWTKRNRKENSRLEFKLRIPLNEAGAKAEFVRDVIALANSNGEFPRGDGHLVIGFREGQFHDVSGEGYDGAAFGQILDAFISPTLTTLYEEFGNGKRGRIGVLTITPDEDALYLVRKQLMHNDRTLLSPGQTWGRRATRKIELDGDAIHARIAAITERSLERARSPLLQRIERLEQESGASLQVKHIRFVIEDTQDPTELLLNVRKLYPYASEFDNHVKKEVLQAVSCVTDRTRHGIGIDVLRAVDAVLGQLMPMGSSHHCRHRATSAEEAGIIRSLGDLTFDITWDACRYLRDAAIVKIGARRYWTLIRFVTLNRLRGLEKLLVEEARRCQEICNDERAGVAFPEGWKILDETITDALDVPDSAKQHPTRKPP